MKKLNLSVGWRFPIFIIVTLFLLFFNQFLLNVPFNFHSSAFLTELLIFLLALFACIKGRPEEDFDIKVIKNLYAPIIVIVLYILATLIGSPYTGGLHNYKNQADVDEVEFSSIPAFDKTQVQLIDKNTARQLGDRVFGTLGSEEVCQYNLGDEWTQIAIDGVLKRVTPIEFDSFMKYLLTRTTPGYVIVDCQSGEADLVRSEGMKYLKSSFLMKDINRHLFFINPTAIYGPIKFELDDTGKPFWIAPVYQVTWVSKTRDVKGVYVVDPVSGDAKYYDKKDAPAWIDNIYPVEVIYDHFNQSKRYENGLFNFANKGVVEFTDDYAYVRFDDDVSIYTGVTSVGKDESNVGFAYVNLRTGKISYIREAGAEEYSARSSAEGALQQYRYSAIFPSMVNAAGRPTYFMGMVDSANLIKAYAFVSYENYQYVATGTTVEEAYRNYLALFNEDIYAGGQKEEKTFTVAQVQNIVRDGNTLIVILDTDNNLCWYDISDGDLAASFIKEGETLTAIIDDAGKISEFIR